MSEEKDPKYIEKELDFSQGAAETVDLSVEVPVDEGNGKKYRYTVKADKKALENSLLVGSIKDFWTEIEKAVMEDVNKV